VVGPVPNSEQPGSAGARRPIMDESPPGEASPIATLKRKPLAVRTVVLEGTLCASTAVHLRRSDTWRRRESAAAKYHCEARPRKVKGNKRANVRRSSRPGSWRFGRIGRQTCHAYAAPPRHSPTFASRYGKPTSRVAGLCPRGYLYERRSRGPRLRIAKTSVLTYRQRAWQRLKITSQL
jgi:hypothetical protein